MELFAADRNQVDSGWGLGGMPPRDCWWIVIVCLPFFYPCSFVAVPPPLVTVNCGFRQKFNLLRHNKQKDFHNSVCHSDATVMFSYKSVSREI